MWSDKLIEHDRIAKVSDGFYNDLQRKMAQGRLTVESTEVTFKKRHLWLSIAAGILLGLLISGVHSQKTAHYNRQEAIENLASRYYIDDMKLENIEERLFN